MRVGERVGDYSLHTAVILGSWYMLGARAGGWGTGDHCLTLSPPALPPLHGAQAVTLSGLRSLGEEFVSAQSPSSKQRKPLPLPISSPTSFSGALLLNSSQHVGTAYHMGFPSLDCFKSVGPRDSRSALSPRKHPLLKKGCVMVVENSKVSKSTKEEINPCDK